MTHTPGPGWEVIDGAATILAQLAQNPTLYRPEEIKAWSSALRAIELSPIQAAAPALLEACEKAEQALKDIIGAAGNGMPYSAEELERMFIADYNAIHSAIAQAKGE